MGYGHVEEFVEALELIVKDVKARPERKKKSVVTISFGYEGLLAETNGPGTVNSIRNRIQDLIDIDVPVFAASGNERGKSGRDNIDTHPALLATPDFPLITVGSAEADGPQSLFSQGGPHLTINAVGNQITCMSKTGNTPRAGRWGTSFAAPLVAAEAAVLLSYDTVPFDTSDGKLVKNLRNYLQSDKASWNRYEKISMLWSVDFKPSCFQPQLLPWTPRYANINRNGVQESDNPPFRALPAPNSASPSQAPTPAPPPPPPQPVVTCNGIATKKYVARDGLVNNIQNDFCPDAIKQGGPDPGSGSIGRVYNKDTMEQVSIYLDIPPGTPMPSEDDCKAHFLLLVDGCDGNDASNPVNYKGGGLVTVGTNLYHITPESLRQPASDGLKGGCDASWKALWNDYTIWGHGWESANNGQNLKQQVKGCALLPDTWSFAYGLGDDGREWTAKFRTGALQKKCMGHAMKTASGTNTGCGGSG
jgi:subtilisin family serine protease